MNLGELLDELRNGMLRDRSDQISGPSDYLWSDQTLIRYINEAQRRFARLGLVLRDASTPECCEVDLVAGQTLYPLHKSVISVISAKYPGDVGDLGRTGHASLNTHPMPDRRFFNPGYLSRLPPGKVLAFTTDEAIQKSDDGSMSVVTLRVFPEPSSDFATPLNLRVVRLPIEPLCDMQDTPEIPEDHHLEMLDWAAYLALRISDHDAGDVQRAAEFRALFDDHIVRAKKLLKQREYAPLEWGFGRNGFRWST